MKISAFLSPALAFLILGCADTVDRTTSNIANAPLDWRQRMDTCRSDTDRFIVMGEHTDGFRTAGVLDSVLVYLDSLRAIAGDNERLKAKAEVVGLNARLFLNDTSARGDALRLAQEHHAHHDPNIPAQFQEFLGLVYARTGQAGPADSVLTLAETNYRASKDTLRWVETMLERMSVLNYLGRNRDALNKGIEAMRIAPLDRDPTIPSTCAAERANAYRAMGLLDSAIHEQRIALREAERLHDTLLMVATGYNLSEQLTDKARYAEAQLIRNKAKERANAPGVEAYLAPIEQGRGRTLQLTHRWAEAIEAFSNAEAHARKLGMQDLWPMCMAGRAGIYSEMDSSQRAKFGLLNAYEQARAILDSALADIAPTGQVQYEAAVERIYGDVATRFKDPATAVPHLQRAQDLFSRVGHGIGVADAQLGLGRGLLEQGDPAPAADILQRAASFFKSNDMRDMQAQALFSLHQAQQRTGRTNEALASLQEAYRLSDLARNDSTRNAMADQEAGFKYKAVQDSLSLAHRVAMSEQQVITAEAETDAARARTTTVAVSAVGILLLASGLFFHRSREQRIKNATAIAIAQANEQLAEEKLRTAEYQNRALRAQMEPHFIRNTIALAIARLNNGTPTANDDASELLARFSDWIDKVLVTSQHATHALRDELNTLGHYLELQRLRSKGKLQYTVTVDPALDPDLVDVPPMLLQPLIENAIEHGLEPRGGEGRITLSAVQREGSLVLCAEDDGVGRNHPKPEGHVRKKGASVSTANIREQLAMLAARTGKRAELRIIDLPQGTRAEVWLPM